MLGAAAFLAFPDAVVAVASIEQLVLMRDQPFQLRPPRVNLTLRGPQRIVQNLTLDEGAVYIDGGSYEPGEHMVEAEVTLPPGVEVVKRDPPVIRLEISEPKIPEPSKTNGAKR